MEKFKKYDKENKIKNAVLIREKSKAWKKANPEKVKKSQKEWHLKNKEKSRNSALKKRYNISIEDYNQMFVDQNGVCAICKGKCVTGRNLSVDHNHETGKVRGLLCLDCNAGLGHFKDNKSILLEAIKYL